MASRTVPVRMGSVYVNVLVHDQERPPPGYLSLVAFNIGEYESDTEVREGPLRSICLERGVPKFLTKEWVGPKKIEREAYAQEIKATGRGAVTERGFILPPTLQTPYNIGVACNVVKHGVGFPYYRTFSQVLSRIHHDHRVTLCPRTGAPGVFALIPFTDPLYTNTDYFRTWVWEGCLPHLITGVMNSGSGGKALNIAVRSREKHPVDNIWVPKSDETILIITRSFDFVAQGRFRCSMKPEKRMTLPQAAHILGIEPVRTVQFLDIGKIEQAYYDLYATWDPARYNMEDQPVEWQAAVEHTDLFTQAYERIVMAKMLQGRKIASQDYRKKALAERVLSRLVKIDTTKLHTERLVEIVWNRDALKEYGIPRNVIEIGYDQDGNLLLITVRDTIEKWIDELYRKPYAGQGYDFDVVIEDWPEEL